MDALDTTIDRLNTRFRKHRSQIFKPFLMVLNRLGVTANQLSLIKLLGGVGFVLLIPYSIWYAYWVYIIGQFIDIFDGALARYQRVASDRGKFIDMATDQIMFFLLWIGIMRVDMGDPLLLAYTVGVMPLLYVMIVVNKNEHKKSDWLVVPVARITYYKIIVMGAVLFYWMVPFIATNFNTIVLSVNCVMSVHLGWHLFSFVHRHEKVLSAVKK